VCRSEQPEHANVWATRLWKLSAKEERTHDISLFLNDDVVCHEKIIEYIEEFAEYMPDEVLSLHSQMPGTRVAAMRGHKFARCYWPSGPAYSFSPRLARELLAWLETVNPSWFRGTTNEDGAIASWLWSRQTPAYATIPALVRHDVSVPSSLGYDNHPNRTSGVDWDLFAPGDWTPDHVARAPYVPVAWFNDNSLRALGEALRGVIPLCSMCCAIPAWVANEQLKTGACRTCAQNIAKAVMDQMLGQKGIQVGT
jgi:hypothetical protein